jgi:hypothetical protein
MFAVNRTYPEPTIKIFQSRDQRLKLNPNMVHWQTVAVHGRKTDVKLGYQPGRGWRAGWLNHPTGTSNNIPLGGEGMDYHEAVLRAEMWVSSEMQKRPHLAQYERD